MASEVEIANRALSRVGATRIVSLTENSVNARAVNAIFNTVRDAELRKHYWNFAIKRARLAADAEAPAFGPANSFTLPSDFLKLMPPDKNQHYNDLDWQVEGKKVLTDAAAPLDIRYIYRVTDPNEMDSLFREAFAMRLARELCEPLTQSNTKIQLIATDYEMAIRAARKADAFEEVAIEPPEDIWISIRQ